MFFLIQNICTYLKVSPSKIDQISDSASIYSQLIQKIEGKCYNKYGFIICVFEKIDIGDPLIDEDGFIKLQVTFQAIAFKPHAGEILDCITTKVCEQGIFASVGPAEVIISSQGLGANW